MRQITWEELTHGSHFKNRTSAITIGVFDGVHRGHRELIRRITNPPPEQPDTGAFCGAPPRKTRLSAPIFLRTAQKVFPLLSFARLRTGEIVGHTPTVITFRENPRRVLRPGETTADIITLDEKVAHFKSLGVAVCVLVNFAGGFSRLRGEDFIRALLEKANMRYLAIGEDFCCGHGGQFSARDIKTYVEQSGGARCDIVPPVLDDGQPVSSSRIRAALAAGDTTQAARLLGHP